MINPIWDLEKNYDYKWLVMHPLLHLHSLRWVVRNGEGAKK